MAARKIYIDSSALYAFTDRANPNHALAVKALESISTQQGFIFTSLQSLQEAHFAITNQLGSTLGFDFLQAIEESSIEVLYAQKAEFVAASKLLKANKQKQVSLKEALIVILMHKRGITHTLTFNYWNNLLGTMSYFMKSS